MESINEIVSTLTTEVTVTVKVQFYTGKQGNVSISMIEPITNESIFKSINIIHFKDLASSKYSSVGVIHPIGAIGSYYIYQKN